MRFQGTLRRLAMIDGGFVEDEARLGLDLAQAPGVATVLDYEIATALEEPD